MGKLSAERLAYERELAKRFTSGGTLIFLHIPKCAGKTVNLILQRESHLQGIRAVGYGSWLFTEDNPDINILRGHLFYGVHKWLREPHVYLTYLRDPVDRIISLYHWLKKKAKTSSGSHVQARFCNKLNLRDWVESERALPYVNNVMTKTIAGTHSGHDGMGVFIGNHGADCEDLLATAKKHLREEFIFDFVSHFDRGYDRFCDLFGWSGKSYVLANVKAHLYPSRETVSPETIEAIREKNDLDLALTRYAIKLLHGEKI